jgi:riboflavin synthase
MLINFQAHVDGTAILTSRQQDGDSVRLSFKFPPMVIGKPTLLRFIVEKGYITIDGASLTVTEVNDFHRTFGVMLIQHTQEKITLGKKEVGQLVNIEVDMVGKYVEKSVHAALTAGGSSGTRELLEKIVDELLEQKLNKQSK